MPRSRKTLVTEFLIRIYADRIDWGGADAFLRWLMRLRPQEGFLPHARALSRLRRAPRSRKAGR